LTILFKVSCDDAERRGGLAAPPLLLPGVTTLTIQQCLAAEAASIKN
jgi:hypothetical protein